MSRDRWPLTLDFRPTYLWAIFNGLHCGQARRHRNRFSSYSRIFSTNIISYGRTFYDANERFMYFFAKIETWKRNYTVTHLRCDGECDIGFVANFSENTTVKEFWKSVKICQSYKRTYSGTVFLTHGVRAIGRYCRARRFCILIAGKVGLCCSHNLITRSSSSMAVNARGFTFTPVDSTLNSCLTEMSLFLADRSHFSMSLNFIKYV